MLKQEARAIKNDFINLGAGDLRAYRLINMCLTQVPVGQQREVMELIESIGVTGKGLALLAISYGAEFNERHGDEKPGKLLYYAGRMSQMTHGELYDFLFDVEVAKFLAQNGEQLISDVDFLELRTIVLEKALSFIVKRTEIQ